MAFTNFYQDSGGNDMNAGSVQNAAASVTSTNGDWGNAAANRFTAASGTPFSGVNVGDWASVYVDGTSTGAVCVAQVTAVNAGGASIDLSTTARYGSAPTNSATGRSCKIGGSWLSELPLTTLTGTVPASTKINLKGNLTITATRTIALAGATTTPLWFSAYASSPGDLDNDTTNSLTKPVWTLNATFQVAVTGAHQIWSGLSVVGNRNGAIWQVQGLSQLQRMRFENTNSNAAAFCIDCTNNAGQQYHYCWLKAPSTATSNGLITIGTGSVLLVGCVADGGGKAGFDSTNQSPTYVNCVALNGVTGFLSTTSRLLLVNCSVYGASTDGVKATGTPAAGSMIVGCLFSGLNGSTALTNGINNASGTNTNNIFRACNDYYNVTNAEVGMGDSPAFFGQTDSSAVAVSATNLTTVATAHARANGFPGIFENETFSGYVDIGAVQAHPPPFGQPGLAR